LDETQDSEFLTLPHPRLHERRFVLVPLMELCPKLVHPQISRTMEELLANTVDQSTVGIWKP
jgi:2-amino-4-hydroxy-6-hydroxymethyldihydropteridine diphosphokinase